MWNWLMRLGKRKRKYRKYAGDLEFTKQAAWKIARLVAKVEKRQKEENN